MVLFGQRLYNKTHDYVDLIEDIRVFFSMFIPEHIRWADVSLLKCYLKTVRETTVDRP